MGVGLVVITGGGGLLGLLGGESQGVIGGLHFYRDLGRSESGGERLSGSEGVGGVGMWLRGAHWISN